MSFASTTGATIGALVVSETKTLAASPTNAVCPITVRGDGNPQLQINESGDWLVHAVALNGDTVRLRMTAAPTGSTARGATLYFKGGELPWSVTTAADP